MISQNENARNFFDKNLLNKLKYPPEDVRAALNKEITVKKNSEAKIKADIINIRNKDEAVNYFKDNLQIFFDPTINDEQKNTITKKVTQNELKYLYQIIYGIQLEGTHNKSEILYKLKIFSDDEVRTQDLDKNF